MSIPDFKDENGQWVDYIGSKKNRRFTKAGRHWWSMISRVDGKNDVVNHTYRDSSYEFENFNVFAEWCQTQKGYGERSFHMDKDILVKHNKCYSRSTCVFVPREINQFVVRSEGSRGKYPLGVHFNERRGKFIAECNSKELGIGKHLGQFDTPEKAFDAYKVRKQLKAVALAKKWVDLIDTRVFDALMNFNVEITD